MERPPLTLRLAADIEGTFPDMVRAHQDGLFSGAYRMLGNRDDAEEVAQEAFLRAYRALQGYSTDRIASLDLPAWLWTITANLCRNRHRTRSRRPRQAMFEVEVTDPNPGPADRAETADLGARLSAVLMTLSWPMRSAVVLRHVVGLPYAEIALALDRPTGTVKADVHRGLARLRETLADEETTT